MLCFMYFVLGRGKTKSDQNYPRAVPMKVIAQKRSLSKQVALI